RLAPARAAGPPPQKAPAPRSAAEAARPSTAAASGEARREGIAAGGWRAPFFRG
ncbi:unnamed protein product, partial [Prorocentrum cordatum]